MRKKERETPLILLVLFFTHLVVSCENPATNGKKTTNDYATVTFANNTQFHVKVYRDTNILFFDELAPGESNTGNIQESVEGNIGTTFRYTYRLKLSESDDIFSGEPFADGDVGDLEETFVIEKSKPYNRNIPVPENIVFNSAYIRVKNNVAFNIAFRRFNNPILQLGNRELMVPSGKTGIYQIGKSDLDMAEYTLQNVETPYNFPNMTLVPGYIYDFILADVEGSLKVIPVVQAKIKPEPTSTWNKSITNYIPGNFTETNSNLNNYLTAIHRYGISHWRSNYPVNKILLNNNMLVSGEVSFGVIPIIIQNTGVAEAYEIPCITAKDTNWENTVFPARNVYAGTTPIAYQTAFNDIIDINNNYVVLSTYTTGLRTGILLSFLNEQGQITDSLDIPAANNLESLTGVKLVKVDTNSFLILGNKKEYTNASDEHFVTSSSIIYKYQYGSKTAAWVSEHKYLDSHINTSICGLETDDSYIVCGYAGNNSSTKTIILKVGKADGAVIEVQNYGAATEIWRPFSIVSDISGNIFITGIATEGATSKAYISKLNNSYEQVWLKKYGNHYDNFLFDLNITNNLLTAVGSANDGTVYDPTFYGWQGGKGWITRIDTETGFLLQETFNNSVSSFNSIVKLADDGYVLAGIQSIDDVEPYWFNTVAIKVNENFDR